MTDEEVQLLVELVETLSERKNTFNLSDFYELE